MADLEIDKITEMIIGAAHKVSNTLGSGFIEHVYENALAHQTRKDGPTVLQQHRLLVRYDNAVVGEFFLDMLVNDLVIVEIKAVSTLANEHMAQGFNYLRASGLPACLLINFGQPRIQLRRLYPSPTWKVSKSVG
ncbi:MAG TPA: GxxExxY protein [Anaerolineales bacterium]|nr:GxxExxY protein [Anaerolineales bacterium]